MSITSDAIGAETAEMVRHLAMPRRWSDTRASAKRDLARSLQISVHTLDRIIYGRMKRVEAALYLSIREKYEAWERREGELADARTRNAREICAGINEANNDARADRPKEEIPGLERGSSRKSGALQR